MNSIEWNDRLSLAKDIYILEADPLRDDITAAIKRKNRAKCRGALAASVALVLATALVIALLAGGNDPTGPVGPIDPIDPGAEIADPTGQKLWNYNGMDEDSVRFRYQSPTGVQVLLDYSAPALSSPDYRVEEDACAVLFGQYLSSLIAYDYDAHFALYPRALVDATFTAQVGDYEAALDTIQIVAAEGQTFDRCSLSYQVASCVHGIPDHPDFKDLFEGYDEWFEQANVDLSAITDVRVYYFTDLKVTLNDTYTHIGDPGLGLDVGFRFYKYEGRWYPWPATIDDDRSVDLARSTEAGTGYRETKYAYGTITAFEGDYISLGDENRYYAPNLFDLWKVGDTVRIGYCDMGIDLRTEDGTLSLYRLSSISQFYFDD